MSLFTLDTMSQARGWEELSAGFRWQVPARFNLGWDCCGRHASGAERLALYFEDEAGATSAFTFRVIQQAANQLSNALRALGVQRGDRVAIVLPQRRETAIAHIAIYQMGAIALPLSHLFGPDALEYRLRDAGACSAVVDADTLPRIWPLLRRLPQLKHVIGVAGARENGVDLANPACRRQRLLRRRRHCGRRGGDDHLHQRHHGTAEGRIDPALCAARQPAGIHMLA